MLSSKDFYLIYLATLISLYVGITLNIMVLDSDTTSHLEKNMFQQDCLVEKETVNRHVKVCMKQGIVCSMFSD